MPESPRWLMIKKRNQEAYRIFKRIADSNKRPFDGLAELENLKIRKSTKNQTKIKMQKK